MLRKKEKELEDGKSDIPLDLDISFWHLGFGKMETFSFELSFVYYSRNFKFFLKNRQNLAPVSILDTFLPFSKKKNFC